MIPKHNGEVCDFHVDLETTLSAIRTDIKWLLRLGYGAVAVVGTAVVVLWPYFHEITTSMQSMREQIAVNTKAIATICEQDRRTQCTIEELRKNRDK